MAPGGIKTSAFHANLPKHGELPVLVPGERRPGGQQLSEFAKDIQDGTTVVARKMGMLHAQTVAVTGIRDSRDGGMF